MNELFWLSKDEGVQYVCWLVGDVNMLEECFWNVDLVIVDFDWVKVFVLLSGVVLEMLMVICGDLIVVYYG